MILLTGASGFLGRFVAAQMERENVGRLCVDLRDAAATPEPFCACDIGDAEAVASLFHERRFDAIIHLAAILPSAARSNPSLATRVNVTGSVNLMEAAARFGVRRVVFGSSVGVYGTEGSGAPVSEWDPAAPTDIYGAAKRYVEVYGETAARAGAFSFAALRLANIVGPGARNTGSPWRSEIFEKLATGARERISIPYRGDAVLSMVHAEDAARMLTVLATRDSVPCPVYNSPAGNWTAETLKDFVEGLDANVTVDLDPESRRAAPPVADGALFVRDFGFCGLPLADRLREFHSARSASMGSTRAAR